MAEKFVDFYKYCKKCKHKDKKEIEEPCDDCLEMPVNDDSHKPVLFEEDSSD